VDFSSSMRALSNIYVTSSAFAAVPSEFADHWAKKGGRADAVISVWVLQHCPDLDAEVDRIASFLDPGGLFVLINTIHSRAISTDQGWVPDGASVEASVLRHFHQIGQWPLDAAHVPQAVVDMADIRLYQRR
jgi:2-polyprenyl-3-methyl-5-hydroxy-6-metoxy-1,4-benzoquinol methylase